MNAYAQDVPIVRLRRGHRLVLVKKPERTPVANAVHVIKVLNTVAPQGITRVLVPVLQSYAHAVHRRVVCMVPVPRDLRQ